MESSIFLKNPYPGRSSESVEPFVISVRRKAAANTPKKLSCGSHGFCEDKGRIGVGKRFEPVCGAKRCAEETLCGSYKKKSRINKMDRSMRLNCFVALKRVMRHPYSSNFVNLGTIKSKLEKDLYMTPQEFEDDVRLIFSSEMHNSSHVNPFHKMAKKLNFVFSKQCQKFVWSDKTDNDMSMKKDSFVHSSMSKASSSSKSSGVLNTTPPISNNLKMQQDKSDAKNCQGELSSAAAKTARVEMLKLRFADTILKAENKTILCPGQAHKVDQVKERNLHQRQKAREAARIALEKMERTVDFGDNISVLKDFAYLIGDLSSLNDPTMGS